VDVLNNFFGRAAFLASDRGELDEEKVNIREKSKSPHN
jgi:hypothetical protein